jgi:hypothetical protein
MKLSCDISRYMDIFWEGLTKSRKILKENTLRSVSDTNTSYQDREPKTLHYKPTQSVHSNKEIQNCIRRQITDTNTEFEEHNFIY